MKTNREMTESVLLRAAQVAAKQKLVRKRAAGILAGVLSVALIVGLFFVPWGAGQPSNTTPGQLSTSPTEPTYEDVTIFTGQVYLLSSTSEFDMLKPMKTDMTYAVDHVIKVFPTSAKEAADEFYDAWVKESNLTATEGSRTTYRSKKTIIYSLSSGFTSVILPDYTQIAKVDMESTGVFGCGETHATIDQDHTVGTGDHAVTIPKGSYRAYLNVTPSAETIRRLEEDPKMPLSTLHDTITLTIHYTNGTTEVLKFNVSLDDEGHVYLSPCRTSTV